MMKLTITHSNLNEYGRFDELVNSVDFLKAKDFFEKKFNREMSKFEINMEVISLLEIFILSNGIDVDLYKTNN